MNRILIVVDMQNDFIDGSLGSAAAQAIVPRVCEKIRRWHGPIIATADFHDADYMNTMEGRKLPVPHCIEGTEGVKLADTVTSALEESGNWKALVRKETFGSRDLPGTVKAILDMNKGYQDEDFELDLIGLDTDICVVSNALLLKAFYPEHVIRVDAACCAGSFPEKHEAALAVMESCHIEVLK